MKADWDDAPNRYRSGKRKLPISITVIVVAGLIAGICYMSERNGWTDYLKQRLNAVAIRYQPQPTPITRPNKLNQPAPENGSWPVLDQDKLIKNEQHAARQTVFNDSNYRPRADINTIPGLTQHAQTNTRPAASRQPQGLSGSRQVRLRWQDARRNKYEWLGEYRWQNNQISYNDLCTRPIRHRKGSIEYRACRKAAKTYLRDQCRAGRDKSQAMRRIYCRAENAFRH